VRAITPVELLRRVHDVFDAIGLRDTRGVNANAIAEALQVAGRIDADLAGAAISRTALSASGLTRDQVREALAVEFDACDLIVSMPLLIPAGEIESFARAAEVEPADVASLRYPLPILEDDVKRAILHILGEPFEQRHSGAELSDIFTPRVRLGGREVVGAFMLKGRGLVGPLRAKNAGDVGNQVTKLSRTGADVFIVQHVHEIDMDVRTQLEHSIAHARTHGRPQAVGSAWDGAETARVLLAYGCLDLAGSVPRVVL
jgi:hypothetical protein